MIGGRTINRVVENALAAPAFDQRPGALEATAGLYGEPIVVVGKRDGEGWKVSLLGTGLPVMLAPDRAREMAADLLAMADICEGYWGV